MIIVLQLYADVLSWFNAVTLCIQLQV